MTQGRSVLMVLAGLMGCSLAAAQVHLTKEDALQLYFPQSMIERKTVFLTDEQVEAIQTSARTKVDSKIVTYYVGRNPAGVNGYAFFDTRVVRTMPETFMVVLNPDSTIRAVEILAFYEPEDYRPPDKWMELFRKKTLKSDLLLKRGIPNIVGATLTAQSITQGIRQILATFELAVPKEK